MTRSARAFPEYSRSKVDAAGQTLISTNWHIDDYDEALRVINNWRSSHSFPLNTFHIGLRGRAERVDNEFISSERIKRLSSIEHKLSRFKTRLSQMQDIGGCRATVANVDQVLQLVTSYEKSDLKHELDHKDNYIRSPQSSGYRGIHLIYKYRSDKKDTHNGLKIEVHIRSQTQHAWATAVETVGTFIKQALKSSKGEADWLRFFALVGSAFAIVENTELVPDTPREHNILMAEIKDLHRYLDVRRKLEVYGATLKTLEDPVSKKAHYYLLK
ncbi:MAG: RelA/SpoT domain-containing protein [Hyphomicrobiales bacterium]|nr:RelA/SpoT domain-containing protein [Hyphomicrobiales bacterium]